MFRVGTEVLSLVDKMYLVVKPSLMWDCCCSDVDTPGGLSSYVCVFLCQESCARCKGKLVGLLGRRPRFKTKRNLTLYVIVVEDIVGRPGPWMFLLTVTCRAPCNFLL